MAAYAVASCSTVAPLVQNLNFRAIEAEGKQPLPVCPTCGALLSYDWSGYEDEDGQLPVPVTPTDPAMCRAAGGDSPA